MSKAKGGRRAICVKLLAQTRVAMHYWELEVEKEEEGKELKHLMVIEEEEEKKKLKPLEEEEEEKKE